ncbi:MAG TPA: ATP-binding protein [Actinomycetota bacterium]|nr:ATP-binding protein [Actinomycetota bacterium]
MSDPGGPNDSGATQTGAPGELERLRQRVAELREMQERFRVLVEQVPVVTYVDAVRPDPATLYVSPQVEGLLGYRPDELVAGPSTWPDLIHPDDRDRVLTLSKQAQDAEGVFDAEYRMVGKDGRQVWVHDRAVLIRDDEGRPRLWQGVWIDVTDAERTRDLEGELIAERKQAAELRAIDQAQNTFLAAVSHDLRTPLAAILGLATTLEQHSLEPDETKDLAARISANARRLDRMVTDLLDLDRLSRGVLEPVLWPEDLGALVARMVEESDLAGRIVAVQSDRVVAEVDAAKVERIVENLLANAARHTPPDAHIWISVAADDGGVLLTVEDDGPGVPEAERAAVFEPFRRSATAMPTRGAGIGLALVARFAQLHGGRAWVQERTGGGASFRVWLPASPRTGGGELRR